MRPRLSLERVLGACGTGTESLRWRPHSDEVVYAAGTLVVLYSPRLHRQTRFIPCRTAIVSLDVDATGARIAIAESHRITLHDLHECEPVRVCQVAVDRRVEFVRFLARSSTHLITVDDAPVIRVWCATTGTCLASCTPSHRITALDTSSSSSSTLLLACDAAHLSFFTIADPPPGDAATVVIAEQGAKLTAAWNAKVLTSSSRLVSVAFGRGGAAFALTSGGILCRFGVERRALEKWVDLKLDTGHCVVARDDVVAIAGAHGRIRLFAPSTLAHLATLQSAGDALGMVLAPDGQRLACALGDAGVTVWNVAQRTLQRTLASHAAPVIDVVALGGDRLVTIGADARTRLWDADTGDLIADDVPSGGPPSAIVAAPDRTRVAVADTDGNVHLLDPGNSLACVGIARATHAATVLALAFSADASLLASAGADEAVNIYDVDQDLQLIGTFMDHRAPVRSVAFASDGAGACLLVTTSADGTSVRDLGAFCTDPPGVDARLAAPVTVVDERWAITPHGIWTAAAPHRRLRRLRRRPAPTTTSVDASGVLLVVCGDDGVVRLVDWVSGATVARCAAHPGATAARCSDDGRRLYTAGADGCVRVWRLDADLVSAMRRPPPVTVRPGDVIDDDDASSIALDTDDEPDLVGGLSDAVDDDDDGDAGTPPGTDRGRLGRPRSVSPVRRSTTIPKRFRSQSPPPPGQRRPDDDAAVDGRSASLLDAVVTIESDLGRQVKTYRTMRAGGHDCPDVRDALRRMATMLQEALGADDLGRATAVQMDPESTRTLLESYSGQLVALVQAQVDRALTASMQQQQQQGRARRSPHRRKPP